MVVITSGPDSAYAAEYDFENEKLTYFGNAPPELVDENMIVDTNGAGDAFAGGFLSKLMRKDDIEKCMHAGHWAASHIIQNRGCQIPSEVFYKEL